MPRFGSAWTSGLVIANATVKATYRTSSTRSTSSCRLQFFATAGDPEPGDFAFQHVAAELQLRYLAACYYDEPLRVLSRLSALGRSSATLEQAIVGAGASLRATARVALVRSNGSVSLPWTTGQREALRAVYETGAAFRGGGAPCGSA